MAELLVGDRAVLVASKLALAEYALFQAGDIVLESPYPGRSQEVSYATTAADARERLAALGFTASLAAEVADAVRALAARGYARGPTVVALLERLTAAELLDVERLDSDEGTYEGRFVDLAGLAADAGGAPAQNALRCAGLALALEPLAPETPVVLVTRDVTATRKSGERTFARPSLLDARALVEALVARLGDDGEAKTPRTAPLSAQAIVASLREGADRAGATSADGRRLRSLERLATLGSQPERGPLADATLWEVELAVTDGRLEGLLERLAAHEEASGRSPGIQYLRARVALASGSEPPRRIAETAASLALSLGEFHEAELLAAEAWLEAGEPRRAFAYARDLAANAALPSSLRPRVVDVSRRVDDALAAAPPPPSVRHPTVQGLGLTASLPPFPDVEPPTSPAISSLSPRAASKPPSGERLLPIAPSLRVGASRPPWADPDEAPDPTPAGREVAEALPIPEELAREPVVQRPRTPAAMRRRAIELTRNLGQELRERATLVLTLDLGGLERVQALVRERLQDPQRVDREGAWLVERAGAFLSELLVRRVAATWADLDDDAPGHWTMRLADGTTVWPFGRVARFVERGSAERDLVSWVLELEERARERSARAPGG